MLHIWKQDNKTSLSAHRWPKMYLCVYTMNWRLWKTSVRGLKMKTSCSGKRSSRWRSPNRPCRTSSREPKRYNTPAHRIWVDIRFLCTLHTFIELDNCDSLKAYLWSSVAIVQLFIHVCCSLSSTESGCNHNRDILGYLQLNFCVQPFSFCVQPLTT